jgi:hypothetical protein
VEQPQPDPVQSFEWPGNSRPFLRQPQSGFGISDRSRILRRRRPCTPKALSSTRVVPVDHRARQSCIDCSDDGPVISRSRRSANSIETWQSLLRRGYCARRLGNPGGSRRFVHPASGRHEPVAAAITHPQLQAVDENRCSAVVGGPFIGSGNLRPLVRSSHFPQVTHGPKCTTF